MDYENFTAKIIKSAVEAEEEFIFQTIYPYCEQITQQRISKQDLTNALVHYRALERENEMLRNKLYDIELSLEALQEKIKYN